MVVLRLGEPRSRSLRVVPVEGRRALRRFIRLPWSLYADDPVWVPPLMAERHQHLSSGNPYFAHARCRFWIAYRDAAPVGRISAQIDELHVARYADATGFFGMLEGSSRYAERRCPTAWMRLTDLPARPDLPGSRAKDLILQALAGTDRRTTRRSVHAG